MLIYFLLTYPLTCFKQVHTSVYVSTTNRDRVILNFLNTLLMPNESPVAWEYPYLDKRYSVSFVD